MTDDDAIQNSQTDPNHASDTDAPSADDARLVEIVVGDEALNTLPDGDRTRIREQLIAACHARRLVARREEQLTEKCGIAVVILLFPSVIALQWFTDFVWFDISFTWRTVVGPLVTVLIFLFAVAYYITIDVTSRAEGDDLPLHEHSMVRIWLASRTGKAGVLLLGVGASAAWGVVVMPAGAVGPLLVAAFAIFSFVICLAVLLILSTTYVILWNRVNPRQEFLSDVTGLLVFALCDEHEARKLPRIPWIRFTGAWRSDQRERRWFAQAIYATAGRAEKHLPRLASRRLEGESRPMLRDLAAGIAATLRRYAYDVSLGGIDGDRELAGKLRSALLAASYGRWDEIVVVAPAPRVQRFLRKFWPRLVGAALLVFAALAVPGMFASQLGAVGGQLRIGLVIAAALVLFDTPKSAVEKIAELVKQPGGRP